MSYVIQVYEVCEGCNGTGSIKRKVDTTWLVISCDKCSGDGKRVMGDAMPVKIDKRGYMRLRLDMKEG